MMAAPILTVAEQKAALGKKRKKRILKNVLGLPNYLKVESLVTSHSETEKLKNILERLLPSARLPIQKNFKFKNPTSEDSSSKEETAQFKRKQLSLGVNNLNRSIKNGLISAALLANDIEPKFLIHHLNLLCYHNKVPHLHMVGLREITKKCLGFPCIALGFRNSSDFSEAISEIQTLSAGLKKSENCEKSDTDVIEEEAGEQNGKFPFAYLHRSSTKERVFVPENLSISKKTDDFLPVSKGADVKPKKKVSAISPSFVKKKMKKKLKVKEDSSSEEDLIKVPRKKFKKNSVVDRIGNKQKLGYHHVNLVKVSSNPDRVVRKKKSLY